MAFVATFTPIRSGRNFVFSSSRSARISIRSEAAKPVGEPIAYAPKKVAIEAGKSIYSCACGLSKNFPLCDGSHVAYNKEHSTSYAPTQISADADAAKDVFLCMCLASNNYPYCDGTHQKIKPK
mmetsp:Transcript_9576/g.15714  ORF Transcript_9576/g.15714 Transcript_9576/m.15714 type:complete len:124 (+) Transcript_9576:182-553(+)|eukprot:CAMPEP_0184656604 /NCGR_PEP_ID=MMETSP0308-20130426/16620_1 /TAXON_ID=38269 /ORGANISM="Gloeochaete witrockiana, Strain SAG 46.84" /LENGTH=123 /DNA_ID=CAMNT_0027093799 /DNA_START=182 /DNA_END=553 /DNA_ORIENTATION=+